MRKLVCRLCLWHTSVYVLIMISNMCTRAFWERDQEQEEKASATLNVIWSLAGGLGAGGG